MNTVTCIHCGREIELTAALTKDIESKVLTAEHAKHQAELERVRTEVAESAKRQAEALAKRQIAEAEAVVKQQLEVSEQQLKRKIEQAELDAKRQIEQAKTAVVAAHRETEEQQAAKLAETEFKLAEAVRRNQEDVRKIRTELELSIKASQQEAEMEKEENQKLRDNTLKLMHDLTEAKKAADNAQLEMAKKLTEEEARIREAARREAEEQQRMREEGQRLKLLEKDKQLQDALKVNEELQRKLQQGSQQNQGEVLELDLEMHLREEFPFDQIIEIKKGQRGADIKQQVCNQVGTPVGSILWETKNGKWQPAWVPKFKQDIREANANIGVIVSQQTPEDIGELRHLEGNVWVVSPQFATRLAAALRITILQVDSANRMNASKDEKMEALYQFLIGPQFKHRVEAIIESYSSLQEEMEKEKRAFALKWARQEKANRPDAGWPALQF